MGGCSAGELRLDQARVTKDDNVVDIGVAVKLELEERCKASLYTKVFRNVVGVVVVVGLGGVAAVAATLPQDGKVVIADHETPPEVGRVVGVAEAVVGARPVEEDRDVTGL